MEITKAELEKKLITLTKELETVRNELSRFSILEKKYEGGIEIVNSFLTELDNREKVNKELKDKVKK